MKKKISTEKIEFRSCIPEDVEQAVPLIYSSGPDAFSYVFSGAKHEAKDFLAHAFRRKGGEFSYDNHYALLLEGEVVGIGSVFNANRAQGFTAKDFLRILGYYKGSSFPVLIKGLRTENIIRLPKKNEICIAHLGIAETLRGLGLGSKLIDFLMKESNPTTSDVFVLDVSEENPQAQALYERLGFKVMKREFSSLKNTYGHVANHIRMAYTNWSR